jgi:WD40 repeat protein
MWIEKPSWIYHGSTHRAPILSIDVQPLMERFVTSSMDSTIRVWSFEGIHDPEAKDLKLAELTQHCGPVNCVRWNPNTRTFASGSDDKFVIIWELKECGLSDNIEEWKACLTMAGHNSDVKDLSWNKTGKYLASASVDNTIIVWNVEGRQHYPFKTLAGHESFVTSVTFDPYDKYLVSLGEDKRLIVWSTVDWQVKKTLTPPLSHSTTQVLKRICITPDARNLILPGPKQSNYRFMANVIGLTEMETEKYLTGHLQPVSVISASPVLYKSGVDKELTWAIALGGYDSAISIWKGNDVKPIAIRDLFSCAVTDLAWSSDGKFLLSSSNDSTVSVIYLSNELGEVASSTEMHSFMFTLYSEVPHEPEIQHNVRKTILKKVEPQPMNEQKEVRLQNGKRRIQPVMLGTPSQASPATNFVQFKQPASQNLVIMSSPNAPGLPPAEMSSLGLKFKFSKTICNKEANDYTENQVPLNLLHVSSLIKASGDIVVDVKSSDFEWIRTVIILRKGNKQLWTSYLPNTACLIAGSEYFAAVYTEEAYLYCYSITGLLILPELKVEHVKIMEGSGHFLALVCKDLSNINRIILYDLEVKKEVIRSELENVEIKTLLTDIKGSLKIESKNGEFFTFDVAMQSWIRLKNSGLEYFKCEGWNPSLLTTASAGLDFETFNSLEIAKVEMQILRLEYFGYQDEFVYTVKKYANMLVCARETIKIFGLLHKLKNLAESKGDNKEPFEVLFEDVKRIVDRKKLKENVFHGKNEEIQGN